MSHSDTETNSLRGQPQTLTPTPPSERLPLLDVLRGFALFGILMVNMAGFKAPITSWLMKPELEGAGNLLAWAGVKFFFEGKFYVLFSVLFGLGFWQLMEKSRQHCSSQGTGIFLRRIALLLVLGLLHITLMWPGDILVVYALAGLILLLFRKCGNRTLFTWAAILVMLPSALALLAAGAIGLAGLTPDGQAQMAAIAAQEQAQLEALNAQAIEIYRGGSFAERVAMRWTEYASLFEMVVVFLLIVLALFLVGIVAGRSKFFDGGRAEDRLTRWGIRWGLGLGLPLNGLYLLSFRYADFTLVNLAMVGNVVLHSLGGIAFALCYVSVFRWLLHRGYLRALTDSLAKVGRMSLSNYLMQSLICTLLFTNDGFALMGMLSPAAGVAVVFGIFGFQVVLSQFWMARFCYGPLEWVARFVAYGQQPPLRRMATPPQAG